MRKRYTNPEKVHTCGVKPRRIEQGEGEAQDCGASMSQPIIAGFTGQVSSVDDAEEATRAIRPPLGNKVR